MNSLRKLPLAGVLGLFLGSAFACAGVKHPPTEPPPECLADADCVPAQCCHPTSCVPAAQAPDCSEVFCTQECVPGTLDCGQGQCECQAGTCTAVIDNPL